MLSARRRRAVRSKTVGVLLFLLTLPLLLKSIFSLWSDEPGMLLAAGGGWLMFIAAAMLCRRGLQAELAAAERPFAGRPGRRMKVAGGVLAGIATAFTALFAAGHSLPIAVAFGLIASAGYFLLYGADRLAGTAAAGPAADEETAALLQDAYRRLDGIEQSRKAIGSPEFRLRLGNIAGSVERILKLVAEDPRDLRRARKFLTVYLDGAQRIAEDYVRTHSSTAASSELEHNFRTLLVDMENTCDEQYGKLLQHDVSDLEVQIEVLSARLRQEGVA